MPFARSKMSRVFVSYALILSMMSAALLPVFASAEDASSRVLLCTSQGYQWVDLTDDTTTQEQADDTKHCVYCLLGGDTPVYLAEQSPLLTVEWQQPKQVVGRQSALYSISLLAASPRAPPVIL